VMAEPVGDQVQVAIPALIPVPLEAALPAPIALALVPAPVVPAQPQAAPAIASMELQVVQVPTTAQVGTLQNSRKRQHEDDEAKVQEQTTQTGALVTIAPLPSKPFRTFEVA
jgi:hypothetical protein